MPGRGPYPARCGRAARIGAKLRQNAPLLPTGFPHASGRVQIQLPVTAAAITGAITHGQGEKIAASTMLSAKAAVAAILPLRLIAPFSRQATM